MWRNALNYLGLGPDEDFDDYGHPGPGGPSPHRVEHVGGVEEIVPATANEQAVSAVRPLRAADDGGTNTATMVRPSGSSQNIGSPAVRPLDADVEAPTGQSMVRPRRAEGGRPHVVNPASFGDAKEVADRFSAGTPVIINLQSADHDLIRRLIDFSSGVCYSLGGQMEKIAKDVFMLTPVDAHVSDDDRRRIERGLAAD
ncbi:MAG: cell division protein SepF [Actinomycetia bacterium]|nr:cell division protein SepF [Actinomycetes bacterium]